MVAGDRGGPARCDRPHAVMEARQANRPVENTDLVGWYTLGGGLARHAHYVAPLPDSGVQLLCGDRSRFTKDTIDPMRAVPPRVRSLGQTRLGAIGPAQVPMTPPFDQRLSRELLEAPAVSVSHALPGSRHRKIGRSAETWFAAKRASTRGKHERTRLAPHAPRR
jgi:hypothetical protein